MLLYDGPVARRAILAQKRHAPAAGQLLFREEDHRGCHHEDDHEPADDGIRSGQSERRRAQQLLGLASEQGKQRTHAALDAEQPHGRHPVAIAQVSHDEHDEDGERGVGRTRAEIGRGLPQDAHVRQDEESRHHERQRDAVDHAEVELAAARDDADEHDGGHRQRAERRMRAERRLVHRRFLQPVRERVDGHEQHDLPRERKLRRLGARKLAGGQRAEPRRAGGKRHDGQREHDGAEPR